MSSSVIGRILLSSSIQRCFSRTVDQLPDPRPLLLTLLATFLVHHRDPRESRGFQRRISVRAEDQPTNGTARIGMKPSFVDGLRNESTDFRDASDASRPERRLAPGARSRGP